MGRIELRVLKVDYYQIQLTISYFLSCNLQSRLLCFDLTLIKQ